jgi:hypothetical protein
MKRVFANCHEHNAWQLFSSYSSLLTVHSSLFTPHGSLFTLYSSRFTLHSSLLTPHGSLFTLYSSRFTLHSSLFTLLFTVHKKSHIEYVTFFVARRGLSMIFPQFILIAYKPLVLWGFSFEQSKGKVNK